MIQENVRILWNTIECSGYYRMGLSCDPRYAEARPGQFVMVHLSDRTSPLLRRPFSIHRLIENDGKVEGLEILYKVVGTGTQRLSMLRKGDGAGLLGPLGNRFTVPETGSRFFIVCGGIGVAPMFFLTESLQKQGKNLSDCKLFIGGRSKDDLLCVDDFFNVGMERLYITTDDGSAGEKELVTGPLERAVAEAPPDMIFACGPLPMLRAIEKIALQHGIPCQLSIESLMACGMGACLGCAVRRNDRSGGYLHVCSDGPVFDAGILVL